MLAKVSTRTTLTLLAGCLLVSLATPCAAQRRRSSAQKPLPFSEIQKAVEEHFKPTRDFQPGDLITRSDVQAVLGTLASIGWNVPRQDEIVEMALPDDDFLVEQLRSKKGKKVFDRVAKYPGALDKLDRMRQMPKGEATFTTWVQKTKHSAKLFEEILTTPGGQRLLADAGKLNGSKDLNKPTGRIYRVAELLTVLNAAYQDEMAGRR